MIVCKNTPCQFVVDVSRSSEHERAVVGTVVQWNPIAFNRVRSAVDG